MTQTKDLIKKLTDFFAGEEFYEKREDARLELSPDDIRCINYLIHQRNNETSHMAIVLNKIKAEIEELPKTYPFVNHYDMYVKEDDVKKIIDKYKAESANKK